MLPRTLTKEQNEAIEQFNPAYLEMKRIEAEKASTEEKPKSFFDPLLKIFRPGE